MALVSKNFSDIITFTRASTATYFDSTGTLQSAAIDAPRFDFNPSTLAAQGLLIEESRTNSIRNNTMQGAVAGTPGTAPTGWFVVTAAGITRELVGTGTENGVTYIDYRFSGTATGNSDTQLIAGNLTSAVSGQTWTFSNYAKIVAGSLTNVTVTQLNIEYDSAGTFLAASTQNITPTTAALGTQRFSLARTFNNASTQNAGAVLRIASAGAIDITLRIGMPQLELGAFATSVIPTTTTALTRAADVASVNTLSPWYNASAGTIYSEFQSIGQTTTAKIALFDNGAGFADSLDQYLAVGAPRFDVYVSSSVQASLTTAGGAIALNTTTKFSSAYAVNDFAACRNGGTVVTDTSGTLPPVSRFLLGNATLSTQFLNGYLRRVSFFPRRLSNAELQAITA